MMAMLQSTSTTPSELDNYVWPAHELARFRAYMAGAEPLWEPPKVEPPRPQAPGIGHNSAGEQPSPAKHSFQDNADELIRVGRLITSFKRIGLAIRARRCERTHLLVLYSIMEKLNEKTGTAFPSRRGIAEQEGLNERVVENAVYELRSWGYIDWEKRAEPDLHKGRLLHYTLPVRTWTEQELTKAILAHREALKARSTPPTVCTAHGVLLHPVEAHIARRRLLRTEMSSHDISSAGRPPWALW